MATVYIFQALARSVNIKWDTGFPVGRQLPFLQINQLSSNLFPQIVRGKYLRETLTIFFENDD